jgi:hypothetical protein
MSERAYHDEHVADAPVVTRERLSAAAIVRAAFAVASVAALAIGVFLDWVNDIPGENLAFESYWRTPATTTAFFASAGILMIGIAVAGIIGLAFRGGWLLRLAGVVGLAAVLLLLVQLGRADLSIGGDTDEGLWLCLAGSAGLLIAGFVPTTKTVADRRPLNDDRPGERRDGYV